jgi:putative nucleotidyltransferase with HDIG domain
VPLEDAWLVGGSVRDLMLGRPVADVDLMVDGDPGVAARGLAARIGGAPFPLSERHGAWRVVQDGRTVDVTRTRGSVEEDLAQRDFTINAMAIPLAGGDLVDPHGGRPDLDAGLVRAVSDRIYDDDPLRLLRVARIARQLGFVVERGTEELARRRAALAAEPSGERVYAEMWRLLAVPDPSDGIRMLDRSGVLAVVLPELTALQDVVQSGYHHLDVFEHTLQVLDAVADVELHPAHYLPEHAALLDRQLATVVGDDLPSWLVLRLAALFHDVAKPQTRSVSSEGRIGFMGHDAEGARIARDVLGRRWKASGAVVRCVSLLVEQHLVLGFTVRERPLGRRQAFRYRRATRPWTVESIVLSLADRMSTRGPRTRHRHVRVHAETAAQLLGLVAELETEGPPLLRGDEIAAATGCSGSEIGRLVDALAEEQAAGAVTTREEAIEFVRALEV